MIDLILRALELGDMYFVYEEVDISKGINKMPTTVKEGIERIKRINKWQRQ